MAGADRRLHPSGLHAHGFDAAAPKAIMAAGSAIAMARNTIRPGRIRKGPAPQNLAVPPYAFLSDTKHQSRLRSTSMSGQSTYVPKSGFDKWIDQRLPLPRLMHDTMHDLPDAAESEHLVHLRRHPHFLPGRADRHRHRAGDALCAPTPTWPSIPSKRIMRDVNYGWLMRYIHSNGASMFFLAVYIHMFRGLYYGSYKAPRELIWILGVLIYLLMMATAFFGYVLPWGQMSFWGATVITNLFSADRPAVGHRISPPGCGAISRSATPR